MVHGRVSWASWHPGCRAAACQHSSRAQHLGRSSLCCWRGGLCCCVCGGCSSRLAPLRRECLCLGSSALQASQPLARHSTPGRPLARYGGIQPSKPCWQKRRGQPHTHGQACWQAAHQQPHNAASKHWLPAGQQTTAGHTWPASAGAGMERRYSGGVSSLGRPCLSSLPSATSCFFFSAMGPKPHLQST